MSDLIKRSDVIKAIDDKINGSDNRLWLREIISELPSVEPQCKKGKWIPVTNGRGGNECDQCHAYAPSYASGDEHLSDFCPHCGADMRGEQDD